MSVPRPPFTHFQSQVTGKTPCVDDIVHHRETTQLLALGILLDNAPVIVGTITAIAFATLSDLNAGQYCMLIAAILAPAMLIIGWNLAWMRQQSPVFSTLLRGGTVYVIEDPSGHIGLTTKVGVAEDPNVRGVVEAVIPGILFFSPAELRQFKPSYTYAQIPWTMEAITKAMQRQRAYRLDWD